MKKIKELENHIHEEIEDAECYTKLALLYKDDDPALARVYYDLGVQEIAHADKLHESVVAAIDQYRREHGEPPEAMLAVYEYLHEREIEEADEVKVLQAMFVKR